MRINILTLLLLIPPLLFACAAPGKKAQSPQLMEWSSLKTAVYDQRIHLCGWFEAGVEECDLSPSKDTRDPAERIWVLTRSKICLPENAILHPQKSWADVTGTLVVGGGFGHLGMYDKLLDESEIRFRKTPCEASR